MRIARFLLSALVVMFVVACGSANPALPKSSGLTVTVALVAPGTVEQWASLAGTFEPRDEAVAAIDGAGGRILSLAVEVGDQVTAGHEIAVLDDANARLRLSQHTADVARARATYAQVAAQVAEAEADSAEAARSVERLESLAAERAVAAETIGAKRAAQLTAAARTAAAKAALAAAEADQARLVTVGEEIALAVTRTRVLAPVAGFIATRPARVGQVVQSGEVVASIAVGGIIEFAAEVPEAILAHLDVGAPVELIREGATLAGSVRRVDPAVDRVTRLGAVRVALDAQAAQAAAKNSPRIGTSARVRARTGIASGLVVPVSALVRDRGQTLAVVIAADGRAHRLAVTTGLDDGQHVIIISGLEAGQQVVAQAPGFVTDGAHVDIVPVTSGPVPARASATAPGGK